jgi:hypothetical protein
MQVAGVAVDIRLHPPVLAHRLVHRRPAAARPRPNPWASPWPSG